MPLIQEYRVSSRPRPRIVLVDGEPASARQIVATVTAAGYECKSFVECDPAIAMLKESGADVIVADFVSERSAAELIRRVRVQAPQTALVLMVSNPTVSAAVAAMRQGAFDYLTKPINTDELSAVLGKALEMASLRRENRLLHEQLDVASMAAAFIAESASSRNLAAIVRRAAPANSPVLIEGESGAGKELVARMLHHWSSRAQGPFVKLSFKSLSGDWPLELSDNGQHANAGVASMLAEYFERAVGGTLFLDEISEAMPEAQAVLLRLLGDGAPLRKYSAPNGRSSRTGAVRIVSSTNRAFAREVAGGRIRPDLYFALNVISIQVAPLRERIEDILPLARHFLALHAAESGRSLVLTLDAERALLAYSWPGNVRELENIIERAVVMSSSERISPESLMIQPIRLNSPVEASYLTPSSNSKPIASQETVRREDILHRAGSLASDASAQASKGTSSDETSEAEETSRPAAGSAASEGGSTETAPGEGGSTDTAVAIDGTLQEFLDRAAAVRIRKAIEGAKGNRNAAASALGIDRTTLYRLIRRLGI